MAFRKKMKRVFGGSSSSEYDSSNPLTHGTRKKSKKNTSENVYKPDESMPKPKYRGAWNQAHQDKLSSFSFSDAWRRKSGEVTSKSVKGTNSEYSPMGSRLPSRGPSRRGSAWSTFSLKGGKRAWGMGSREPSRQSVPQRRVEEEETEDTDITNVGLSRQPTHEGAPPAPPPKDDPTSIAGHPQDSDKANGHAKENVPPPLLESSTTLNDDQLFTAEELAKAMSKSTLEVSPRVT